jgi:hypothetical protein
MVKIIVENEVDGIDYREACGKMQFQATTLIKKKI